MEQKIAVRPAKESEVPLLKRLSVEELPDELNELEREDADRAKRVFLGRMEALLAGPGSEMYVATVEEGTEVAGYVWFGVSERPFSDMEVGWIYDIQVLPAHRGKGVGEALLRHALQVSGERGHRMTGLMVRANNRVASSLYEKVGFEPEYVVMSRKETGVSKSNS